jgi:drug/metabolite transporter (DMT)-like permease
MNSPSGTCHVTPRASSGWLERLTGPALLAAMVLTWSSGFIGYRYVAEQGGVDLATFWRFVLAAGLLLPFAYRSLRRLRLRDMLRQALIGVFAFAGFIAPISRAIEYGVPPATTSVIANLLPVSIVLMAGFVPGQRTRGWQWVGLALCVGGMSIASAASIGFDPASGWASALPLLAVSCLAGVTLYQKRTPVAPMPALTALFLQVCGTLPVFAGLALFEGSLRPPATPGFVFGVVWLAVCATLGGYGFYWLALQRFSLQRISGALFLTPPVTMFWAWLQFDDSLPGAALLGVLLTLLGLPLLGRGQSPASLSAD